MSPNVQDSQASDREDKPKVMGKKRVSFSVYSEGAAQGETGAKAAAASTPGLMAFLSKSKSSSGFATVGIPETKVVLESRAALQKQQEAKMAKRFSSGGDAERDRIERQVSEIEKRSNPLRR